MKHKQNRIDKLAQGGLILPPAPGGSLPVTSIEVLETLRDKVNGEDWVSPVTKRAVMFGIKMCIAVLKKQGIDELTTID